MLRKWMLWVHCPLKQWSPRLEVLLPPSQTRWCRSGWCQGRSYSRSMHWCSSYKHQSHAHDHSRNINPLRLQLGGRPTSAKKAKDFSLEAETSLKRLMERKGWDFGSSLLSGGSRGWSAVSTTVDEKIQKHALNIEKDDLGERGCSLGS